MDPGYLSDPTTATTSEQLQEQEEPYYQHHQHQQQYLHPLRLSLSSSDIGSSSLHASQRLQSTPQGKQQQQQQPRAGVHRVYRSPRPASSSATGTYSDAADSSVSLSSLSSQDTVISSSNNNNNHNADTSPKLRQYWQSIVLDVENSDADRGSLRVGRSNLIVQAPSTGSSTLVDQESLFNYAMPPSALQRNTGQSALSSNNDARRHPLRSLSSEDAPSRFAVAASYAELEQERRDRSASAERSLTPQQHSYRNEGSSSSNMDGQELEGESQVAGRVHDIFKRHIHNASTSYASRRSSLNTTAGASASNTTQRPRQRLRDLLATSVSEAERSDLASISQRSRPSMRSARVSEHPARAQHTSTRYEDTAPDGSRSTEASSRSRIDSRRSPPSRKAPRLDSATLHEHERTIEQDGPSLSASASRLSHEWRDLSHRAAEVDLLQQRSMGGAQASETDLEEEEQDDVNDGDVEDHEPEREPHGTRLSTTRNYANAFSSPGSKSSRRHLTAASTPLVEEYDEDEEDDFSPSLLDLPSDEEDLDVSSQLANYSQTPGRRKTSNVRSEDQSRQQARNSPKTTVVRVEPTLLTPPAEGTNIHASPLRRSTNHLFQNTPRPKTPPKTPHLPGHYLSTTPFVSHTSPSRNAITNGSMLDQSTSRLIGNTTLSIPSLPGTYTSPFPHPRQSAQISPNSQMEKADSPSSPSATQIKQNRFSAALKRAAEQAEEDFSIRYPQTPAPPGGYASTADTTQDSPSRRKRTAGTQSASARSSDKATAAASPSQSRSIATPASESAAVEGALPRLLQGLATPLKGLIGMSTSPQSPSIDQTSEDQQLPDLDHAGDKTLGNFLSSEERKKLAVDSRQKLLLQRLREAEELDESLIGRAEQLKMSLADMSAALADQPESVYNYSGKRRKLWLCLLCLLPFLLAYAVNSLANARAYHLFQTQYYDPFYPELYSLDTGPLSSLSTSFAPAHISTTTSAQSPETIPPYYHNLMTYFRTSSNSILSFLPITTGHVYIPESARDLDDTSVMARQSSATVFAAVSSDQSTTVIGILVHQFLDVIRSLYSRIISVGLGSLEFPHGTLGGGSFTSGSVAAAYGQSYRVPT